MLATKRKLSHTLSIATLRNAFMTKMVRREIGGTGPHPGWPNR
jgi:hypothetical protein